jgi:N-acetylglutamate synthase and related acetyltransferases
MCRRRQRPRYRAAVEIRRATVKDSNAISSLLLDAFGPFESGYTAEAFAYTTPPADVIRERFVEGPIWVVVNGDLIIGTVSGLPEPDRFYIRSMAVKPTAQGGGVGQKLLVTLEEFARNAGYSKLYLYTTFVLPGARRLYEKNGFYVLRETSPEEWCNMGGLEMEKELD